MSQYFTTHQKSDVIFSEGSDGAEAYIVIAGAVGIFKDNMGRPGLLHRLGPGEMFGELAVINAGRRLASAVVIEDNTTVMAVDKARFFYLVSHHPGFAVMVMETLSRWLRNGAEAPSSPSATTQLTSKIRPGLLCEAVPVTDNIWQFRTRTRSCNAYLFKGRKRTVLVDPGLDTAFASLASCLNEVGVSPDAIDTIILTHEHFDHVAATPLFTSRPSVAAHILTARKIANIDEFTILRASYAGKALDFTVDTFLADGSVISTGDHQIRVVWTPGHSSGCLCLFEEHNGMLVTGDTLLSGGILGGVFGSGNISDTIYSLEMLGSLRATRYLPGHGAFSDQPRRDIDRALESCRQLLSDTRVIVETLNAQNSINKIMLSLRDLNR